MTVKDMYLRLSPRHCERSMPGDPSGKTPVNPSAQKYSTFPNFGFMAYTAHPGPAKGAFATVTRCGPGLRWTRQRRRDCVRQGGKP